MDFLHGLFAWTLNNRPGDPDTPTLTLCPGIVYKTFCKLARIYTPNRDIQK